MPSEGLCLRVTHTGVSQGSIHLSDIVDGVDVLGSFRKAGAIYVPYNQSVELVYSSSVAISFESGAIRGFIERGLVTAEFVFGAEFGGAVADAGAVEVRDEGTTVEDQATVLNFIGGNIAATNPTPGVVNVTVTGTGGAVIVEDEGVIVEAAATSINFVGPDVVASNPGVGQAEITVGLTGAFQALDNPTTSTALATFLDSNYQPTFSTDTSAYTIYVDAAGDDAANDGSVGAPFATPQRALQQVASLNDVTSRATVSLGAGTFTIPQTMAANYVNFQGTTSTIDTLTIGTVVVSNDTDGIVIDVTSTGGPYSADDLRGVPVQWTSGSSNGDHGWIYRNDATSLGVTRIYATHNSGFATGIGSMAPGDTLITRSLDTTISLAGTSNLINSVQQNWFDLNIAASAPSTLLAVSTDKIDFQRCYFDGAGGNFRRLQAGGFGRAFLTTCYYAGAGFGSGEAFLSLKNNGFLQIQRGTVLDADLNADPTRRFVEAAAGSLLAFQKHVVCRGFEGAIFEVDGLGIFAVEGIGTDDTILVEDANGTSVTQPGPVFKINSTGEGQGGWYQLPNLHGSISGDYTVEAQNCACVIVGDGSSTIATNLGTNTVSADAGASNIATAPDLTLIENGSPDTRGFKRRTGTVEVTGTSYTVAHDEGLILVNQSTDATVTITLPAGATHLTGEITVKDKKGTAATRNITIVADGAETIDGGATFVIDRDYAARQLVFFGTEWSIV